MSTIFENDRQQDEYDRQRDRELLDPIREELEAALLEVGPDKLRRILGCIAAGRLDTPITPPQNRRDTLARALIDLIALGLLLFLASWFLWGVK